MVGALGAIAAGKATRKYQHTDRQGLWIPRNSSAASFETFQHPERSRGPYQRTTYDYTHATGSFPACTWWVSLGWFDDLFYSSTSHWHHLKVVELKFDIKLYSTAYSLRNSTLTHFLPVWNEHPRVEFRTLFGTIARTQMGDGLNAKYVTMWMAGDLESELTNSMHIPPFALADIIQVDYRNGYAGRNLRDDGN